MRVAVDARHLGRGRGVARYLESMLTELVLLPGGTEWLAVAPRECEELLPPGVRAIAAPRATRISNASAGLVGFPRLDRMAGGADAVWIPAPAPVAWSRGVPAVLTIHDLSWEARPADFSPYERAWHAVARPRRLASRAAAVTCVSEATRSEILAAGWPVDPRRVAVIPEAPMTVAAEPVINGGSYLLYVGALEPRKGIDVLAAGLRHARTRGLSLPLVVVGSGRERRLLEECEGVRFESASTDSELSALYAGAQALVLPSWLEGFGLPPVEAAAHSVPTVASDLPVFRETLGEGFIPVPPGDPMALGQAMFAVATDSALRSRTGAEAQSAVSRLSWKRSARELLDLIVRSTEGSLP